MRIPWSQRAWRSLAASLVCGALMTGGPLAADPEERVVPLEDPPGLGETCGFPHTFSNAAPIPIPALGPSTLYPSTIAVSGIPSGITDVAVLLNGFTHTFPDDVDIMLVSPSGTRVLLMSDSGGPSDVSGLTLVLADPFDPRPLLPDAGPLADGAYRPYNWVPHEDTFPAPAPAGVRYVSPGAFRGESPNGVWSLYVLDDDAPDSGSITGGWTLTLWTTNSGGLTTILGSGPAAPYPNTVSVVGCNGGFIKKVRVTLQGVTHTFPDDVDVLLQSPESRAAVLMSDAGGSFDLTGAVLTFDDAGPPLPDNAAIGSGTFRPTNHGAGDPFPVPAPGPPYGTTLSLFNNFRPQGGWSLYVLDDLAIESGAITSWGLQLTLANKGDFDGDGRTDFLWRHDGTGNNVLWYLDGVTLREVGLPPPVADVNWKIVGTDDFNGDNRMDILWRHAVSGEMVVWFMERGALLSGVFTEPSALTDIRWTVGGTGDFNGDAKADILWRHEDSGENVAWFMNGADLISGVFLNPASLPDTNWKIVGTGYFDGGGDVDILWWHQVSGQLVVWFMNRTFLSHGSFTTPDSLPDTRWRPVATGDMNRDDRVDIVWRHQDSGEVVVWYMGGGIGTTLIDGALVPSAYSDPAYKLVGPR
jgi:subtilisin-like proprotein convertase family protein